MLEAANFFAMEAGSGKRSRYRFHFGYLYRIVCIVPQKLDCGSIFCKMYDKK